MEEKYTQIKLNVGSLEEASVDTVPANKENTKVVSTKLDDPETIPMDIMENRQETPLDDDVQLVSPDESIFTRVADNVNKSSKKDGYAAEWHDNDGDSDEDFIIDEQYASTTHADKSFMETFGLNTTGSTKPIKENTSNDTESNKDEIQSNSYEYTERLQNQEIKGMYDYAVKGIGKKLIFSLLFAIILFFVENVTLFVKNPQGIFDINAYPYVHLGISAGILVVSAICAYEQIYHGFKSITSRDYIPESVGVVALAVSIIHTITSFILVSFGHTNARMFNFATVAILIGTILFSYVNVVREEFGFRVISVKDTKFILEKVHESNAEAEYDTFTTTSGDFNGEIARVEKTGFVKNYFYNTNSSVDMRRFMGIYYLIILLVPAVFAIISLFQEGSASTLTTYWGFGVLLLLPVGALCIYSVPFYIGNKRLFDDGVAIIGEEAIKEFAKTDIVAVNDTTAFPPQNVKIKNFNIYNDFNIEKVLYYASNGFSVVGGPLADVFDAAANDSIGKCKKVKFVCTGRSYLCVKVDSDKVIFADKFGMTSQGIEVGNEREDKEDSSVMYIAVNGVLCAKMYIKYEFDDEFLRIVNLLNKNGVGIGIRSFDPNISNELIKKATNLKKKDLRVIKLSTTKEISAVTLKSDGKIASKGLSRSLIKAIPVCKRILTTRKVLRAIKVLSSIVGVGLLALWVFGKLSFAFSAHVVGYHMVFLVMMILISLISMPKLR